MAAAVGGAEVVAGRTQSVLVAVGKSGRVAGSCDSHFGSHSVVVAAVVDAVALEDHTDKVEVAAAHCCSSAVVACRRQSSAVAVRTELAAVGTAYVVEATDLGRHRVVDASSTESIVGAVAACA